MTTSRPSPAVSPFSATELSDWRQHLIRFREKFLSDLTQLASEESLEEGSGAKNHVVDPPQETAIAELVDVRSTVALINHALAKITGHGQVPFGICEETGKPIERERLVLMPWTPFCVRGVHQRERRSVPPTEAT